MQRHIFPKRSEISDKRAYGTVLGIGGSRGMAGAVAMAGRAALLAGAGLVRLAVPDSVLETAAGFCPEYTLFPCSQDSAGRFALDSVPQLLEHCQGADAVFLGPGLGRSDELRQLVQKVKDKVQQPLVIDADGLQTSILNEIKEREMPLILTPHGGEFARLRRAPTPCEVRESDWKAAAGTFAEKYKVILVLKGHRTIVTDGFDFSFNETGNPGMATGGCGDVLTGLIAGLLAQKFAPPFETVCLAVHLHGLAGDLAAKKLGEYSVTATAILEHIPNAFLASEQI
ncbi:hypothetical protein FACS189419_09750 [Planctomycetales bacterium]|nr:hypothetical protein FACS189419_09750 [Planctomycetales bacterium]